MTCYLSERSNCDPGLQAVRPKPGSGIPMWLCTLLLWLCSPVIIFLVHAGAASAHLRSWVAAATLIQVSWRARRFRRRLPLGRPIRAKLLLGIARVQACWRRRRERIVFSNKRAAIIVLQVSASKLLL